MEFSKEEKIYLTPRTLADMSPKERAECQWMQVTDDVGNRVVLTDLNEENQEGKVLYENGGQFEWSYEILVPLPHLPRMEWPGNEQEFDPAHNYIDKDGDEWECIDGRWVTGDTHAERVTERKTNSGLKTLPDHWGPYTRIKKEDTNE